MQRLVHLLGGVVVGVVGTTTVVSQFQQAWAQELWVGTAVSLAQSVFAKPAGVAVWVLVWERVFQKWVVLAGPVFPL